MTISSIWTVCGAASSWPDPAGSIFITVYSILAPTLDFDAGEDAGGQECVEVQLFPHRAAAAGLGALTLNSISATRPTCR